MDVLVEAVQGIRAQCGPAVGVGLVVVLELGLQIGEVGEGKLARVGAVAYAQKGQIGAVVDRVVVCVLAALDAALGLRVAV